MAVASKYNYVRDFEEYKKIIPETWIVIRIDGIGFHEFSKRNKFKKPNDYSAINLMNSSAIAVMEKIDDIIIGYGQSDEFSFVIKPDSKFLNRRYDKILTNIVSMFTSAYHINWDEHFQSKMIGYVQFDGRIITYPNFKFIKDYLSWRQVDCHVNNLYNTCFWELVKSGLKAKEAEEKLRGTLSSDKNEILFKDFNINYNNINPIFRKGSLIIKKGVYNLKNDKIFCLFISKLTYLLNCDIINDKFWDDFNYRICNCKL